MDWSLAVKPLRLKFWVEDPKSFSRSVADHNIGRPELRWAEAWGSCELTRETSQSNASLLSSNPYIMVHTGVGHSLLDLDIYWRKDELHQAESDK